MVAFKNFQCQTWITDNHLHWTMLWFLSVSVYHRHFTRHLVQSSRSSAVLVVGCDIWVLSKFIRCWKHSKRAVSNIWETLLETLLELFMGYQRRNIIWVKFLSVLKSLVSIPVGKQVHAFCLKIRKGYINIPLSVFSQNRFSFVLFYTSFLLPE